MDTPCRVCGDPDPGVHHREPGKSVLHLMIALCAGCHAKVHRTKVVLTEFPPLLLVLWREQHPEGHEQTYIDFNVRKPPAQSVPLNFEPAELCGHYGITSGLPVIRPQPVENSFTGSPSASAV
jgi:hypothetical protein